MIFALFFLGVLTIIAGILPFLSSLSVIPQSLTSGPLYYAIVIVIGVGGLLYGFMNQMLMGMQKFMAIVLGLLTVLGGILPLVNGMIKILPAAFLAGWIYSLIIIAIGVTGIIYGSTQF